MADERNKARETLVIFLVVGSLGGAFLFFLNLISLGIVFHVVSAFLVLMIVGMLHYVLWGYAFSREVAGEREEAETRRRMDDERNY